MKVITCECCNGEGTIDFRRFAYADSDPAVPCPDCNGAGELEVVEPAPSVEVDLLAEVRRLCR